MKLVQIIFLLFNLAACSTIEDNDCFPIDIVLKSTLEQQNKLNLGNLGKYKSIDPSFFEKWFEGLVIPELDNKKLKFDHYLNGWFFIDHRQIDEKIVFSILGNGEAGILDLYYLTYDTVTKRIIAINFLVRSYGDEGSYKDNLVEWTGKNSIRVTSTEVNLDEISAFIKVSKRDSFITYFSYADKPFRGKEIFRCSKIGTTRVK